MQRLRDTGSVADRKRSGRAFIMKANSGRSEHRFTKKSIEKTFHLHKHRYKMHILAENDERYAWLQQDAAICHTSRESMEVFTECFDDRVISKELRPARLPELLIQDFFSGDISKMSPSGIIRIRLVNLKVTSFMQQKTLYLMLFEKCQLTWKKSSIVCPGKKTSF
ncbi:uncharacterized protein TNCV_2730261 [Trichonephila clavipes]|nr:uncharacterized protein TNCV_2730261 [Trichonephila clavipes]